MKKKQGKAAGPNYRWIVTAVDYSDSTDGKARVLKCFKTKKAAKAYVAKDIAGYASGSEGPGFAVERGRMSAYAGDHSVGCEWNVEKVDVG